MIISFAGTLGSGKSTVGKLLAKKLGYKHYSGGDFQRAIAQRRGVPLIELAEIAKEDPTVDEETDAYLENLGKTEDNFVVDAHLGFHFIPHSFKIFMKCDMVVASERIFHDKNKLRKAEADNSTMEKVYENLKKRWEFEQFRWHKYYGINQEDPKHYDLVINTTNLQPEEIVEHIISEIKKRNLQV